MADPLEISRGPNRGEAAFLGESGFDPIRQAEQSARTINIDNERKKKELNDNVSLLDDDVKAQWDTDVFNHFEPRIKQLKTSIIEKFKATGGKLSPVEQMEIKKAWNDLQNEAAVSNATYKAYADQVKSLDTDKTGAFNKEESIRNLQAYKNPQSIPELKKEIDEQYGGNVLKWRADNAQRFGLVNSWGADKYYGDMTKDETPQAYQKRDAKGNVVYENLPSGDKGFYEGKKLSDQQVNSLNNRIWTGQRWEDKKAQEDALTFVQGNFSLIGDGKVGVPSSLPDNEEKFAKEVLKRAGDLRGMNEQEVAKQLAKAYTATALATRRGEGETLRVLNVPAPSGGSGSGDAFKDKYVVTSVTVPEETNKVQIPGDKYITEEKGGRTVTIKPKQIGGDNETFSTSLETEKISPIKYRVNDSNGTIRIYYSYPNWEQTEDGKYIKKTVKTDAVLNDEQLTEIAVQYGYGDDKGGVEAFKKDVLKIKPKETKPTEYKATTTKKSR